MNHAPSFRRLLTLAAAVVVAGCAGYQAQTVRTVGAMQQGSVDAALADLDARNASQSKDLLYFLERGELLRMKGVYVDSRDHWLVADERVRAWEDQARKDPSKLWGDVGSYVVNDTTRRYDGRDYEKVFLNVRLALDHLALGNWDFARTEIKKMHEREAIIADYHAKDIESAKKVAKDNGLQTTSVKELNGYPVETLNDPQVRALTNAYESAFANYLAGFVYEALGEPSLAAPGYRKAAEMKPNVPLIDEGLRGLDGRVQARSGKMVDTLIVVESGSAPSIVSQTIPIYLPISTKKSASLVATPLSWPVIKPSDSRFVPASIAVDQKPFPVVVLTNVDLMARRSLSDEMYSIIVRSSARAILKGTGQKKIDDKTAKMGDLGVILSLGAKVATEASEVADERSWRTLPGAFSVARMPLAEGAHQIAVTTPAGLRTVDVQVAGRYAVVSVRTSGNALYVAQSVPPGAQPAALAANPR